LGHPQVGREVEGKAGVVLKLFARDAGIERDHLHAALLGLESEHRQIGHDAKRAAGKETARAPRVAPAQVSGAGDEIDVFDEPALLMLHRYYHLSERGDVGAAVRARQARRWPRRVGDAW